LRSPITRPQDLISFQVESVCGAVLVQVASELPLFQAFLWGFSLAGSGHQVPSGVLGYRLLVLGRSFQAFVFSIVCPRLCYCPGNVGLTFSVSGRFSKGFSLGAPESFCYHKFQVRQPVRPRVLLP
jgi:hypothetical protein